jgi:hypothetical protein
MHLSSPAEVAVMSLPIGKWFTHLPAPPEHVVAFAFEANLPFAEHELLDRLHREGARHLTLLVGASDYTEGFAEFAATRHAGIFYAIHRVRLPSSYAAFHPKLYLLAWHDTARLLVASANLTPTGFRSNLEVVDDLRMSTDEPGDVEAFREYAALLDAIPDIDSHLNPRVAARLRAASASIRELAGRCRQRPERVALLHSAFFPLVSQLREIVAGATIKRLTVLTPFFDDGSAGIRGIVKALVGNTGLAELRVLIDREAAAEVDGPSLLRLARQVIVERVEGLRSESVPRRLHAKVLLVEASDGTAWLVAGSANGTSAAWMRDVAGGGNLEAVTVRRLSSKLASLVFADLSTEPVEPEQLHRERDDECDEHEVYLPLLDASVNGEFLELRCSDGSRLGSQDRLQARLSSRDGSTVLPLVIIEQEQRLLRLRSQRSHDILHSGAAVAVRLELLHDSEIRSSTPVWLDKPLYQELDPSLRAGVRALALLGDQATVDAPDPLADAAQFLAGLTVRLAADIAALGSHTGGSAQGGGSGATSPVERDQSADGGDDREEDWSETDEVSAGSLTAPSLPGGATARRMGGVHLDAHVQMAQRLFDGLLAAPWDDLEEEDSENAAARRRVARLATAHRAGSEAGHADDSGGARPPLNQTGRQLLRRGLDSLAGSVDRVLRAAWSPESVPRLAGTLDALLAALLRYQQHLESWDEPLRNSCAYVLQGVWSRIWSTDGFLLGTCSGFYPRALYGKFGAALRQYYSDPERRARVAAMAAATAVFRSRETGTAGVPYGIRTGLALVSAQGADVESEQQFASRLREYCEALTASLGWPDASTLSASLKGKRGSAPEVELLRVWMPIIRLERRRLQGAAVTADDVRALPLDLPKALASCYRRVVDAKRMIGRVVPNQGVLTCSACENALPTEWATELRRPEFVPICDSCGTLLAPLAWGDDASAALMADVLGLSTEGPEPAAGASWVHESAPRGRSA